MSTIIVNLFGGPGTGKSTTASGVFSLLKLHNVNCEYVPEYAKDCTWESREETLKNQIYVFGKQHHRIWRLKNQVDVVITDSPLLLSLVYGDNNEEFQKHVLRESNEFNNFNVFLEKVKPYNPIGRSQNENEAKAVDNKVKNMLINNNINFLECPGNIQGINIIVKKILDSLNVKRKYYIVNIEDE